MASLPHTPIESTPESSPQIESLSKKLETMEKKVGPHFSESQTDPPHSAVHHSFSPDDIVKPVQTLPVILSPSERQAAKMLEEVPGYFPTEDTLRKKKEEREQAGPPPSTVEKVKNTIVALGDYAKEWSDYAKGYVPASLGAYIGGGEKGRNGSGSNQGITGGIGSLPGTPREADIARLPEEREHSDEINRLDSHAPRSAVQAPAVMSTSNPFRTQKFLQMQRETMPYDVRPDSYVDEPSGSRARYVDTALPPRTYSAVHEPTTPQSPNASSGFGTSVQLPVRTVSPPESPARAVPPTAEPPTTEHMSVRDPNVTATAASETEHSGSETNHGPTILGVPDPATPTTEQFRETSPNTTTAAKEETPATDSAPSPPQRDEGKRGWGLSRRRSQGNRSGKAKELHEPEVETKESESKPKASFRERLSGFFRRKPKELHKHESSSSSESSVGGSDHTNEEAEEFTNQKAPSDSSIPEKTGEVATSEQTARQRSATVPSAISPTAMDKGMIAMEHERLTKSSLEGKEGEKASREVKQPRTSRSYSHPTAPRHVPAHHDETMGPLPSHVELRSKKEPPTQESGSGSRVGVGSLPRPRDEVGAAELPDERRADEARVIPSQREHQQESTGTPSGQSLPSSRVGMASAPQVALGMYAPTQSQDQTQEGAHQPTQYVSQPGQGTTGVEYQPAGMSYERGFGHQQGYPPRTEFAGQQAEQFQPQAYQEPPHPSFFSLDRARKEQEERAREIKTGRRRTIFNAGESSGQTSEAPYHDKSAPVARTHRTAPALGIHTTDTSQTHSDAPGAQTRATKGLNHDVEFIQHQVPQGTGSSSISAPQPMLAPTSLTTRLAAQHRIDEIQTPLDLSAHPSRSSSAEDASPARAPPSTHEQISGTRVDVIHPLREQYFRSAAEMDDSETQMGSGAGGVLPGYPNPAELNALIGERMYDDHMRAAGAAEPAQTTTNRLAIRPRSVVDQLENCSPSNDIVPDIIEPAISSEYTIDITGDIVADSPIPVSASLQVYEDISRAQSGLSTKTEHGSVSEPNSTNITPPTGRSAEWMNESVKPIVGEGLSVGDLGPPVCTLDATDNKERQGYEWEEIRASPHN
ncbi:hypothetical protein P691DRAFT_764860 [Macrolepiota fuliginosa MF-IS2]|uniref:Uncharacterized protein n=1 Tax=Macrolepiota fuliginosa MF-IS2 TaxID=1400762 RepID=A0A9P6BYM3_9AGAR|nr:hypothetical protein P691DRAFT_764860 [Macrolepiota fuliginosa MF-IS2]